MWWPFGRREPANRTWNVFTVSSVEGEAIQPSEYYGCVSRILLCVSDAIPPTFGAGIVEELGLPLRSRNWGWRVCAWSGRAERALPGEDPRRLDLLVFTHVSGYWSRSDVENAIRRPAQESKDKV